MGITFLDEWNLLLEEMDSKIEKSNMEVNEFLKTSIASTTVHDYIKKFQKTVNLHIDSVFDEFRTVYMQDDVNNLDHMELIWGKGFVLYKFYLNSAVDFSDEYLKYLNENNDIDTGNNFVFLSLMHLNGRAIQISEEIFLLIKNGYADGAYARFRSVYELLIIGSFINKYGNEVAKEYISYKGEHYNWIEKSGVMKKYKYYTFKDIETNCGIEKKYLNLWNREYSLSNKLVHASPQGTFSRLSYGGEDYDKILVGPSDRGICAPAINTLITLLQLNTLFFKCLSVEFTSLYLLVLNEIYNKASKEFINIQTKMDKVES